MLQTGWFINMWRGGFRQSVNDQKTDALMYDFQISKLLDVSIMFILVPLSVCPQSRTAQNRLSSCLMSVGQELDIDLPKHRCRSG